MSDVSQGSGWWEASDGKWYSPEQHPSYRPPPPKGSADVSGNLEPPLTQIESEKWTSTAVVLRSDGTPTAFLDAITQAIETAGYPITERSYADLRLCFESRGVSWKSWSGDATTVLVTSITGGSKATFTSKGKPSGTLRTSLKANATTWVERIVPGFGSLWVGPDLQGTGTVRSPVGPTARRKRKERG
jgi:hypothetical protein